MRECSCLDWMPNVKAINGALVMSEIHSNAFDLTPFRFCPWCGRKLIDSNPIEISFKKEEI